MLSAGSGYAYLYTAQSYFVFAVQTLEAYDQTYFLLPHSAIGCICTHICVRVCITMGVKR